MPKYIAFLRGINVGGHRVKMDRLRAIFAELGLKDVSTFIASGNVLFTTESGDADGLRERIESQLASQLGYEVPTFLRSPAELAAIVAFSPPGTSMQTASDSAELRDGPIPFLRDGGALAHPGQTHGVAAVRARAGSSHERSPHDDAEHEHAGTHCREDRSPGDNLTHVGSCCGRWGR